MSKDAGPVVAEVVEAEPQVAPFGVLAHMHELVGEQRPIASLVAIVLQEDP